MIQTEGIFVGGGAISAPIIGEDFNWTGGDGTYQVLDDGGGNWRIKLLSSGTFTPLKNMMVDVFLVGGGGGKGLSYTGAGGAGYTTTARSVSLVARKAYSITVAAAGTNGLYSSASGKDGGATSAFGATAAGGTGTPNGTNTSRKPGGDGGSGGGGYNNTGSATYTSAAGGTDGSDGTASTTAGGTGKGTTTREFGEADGDLYASGGGDNLTASVSNSGNGGAAGIDPADGIVVIRKHKEVTA